MIHAALDHYADTLDKTTDMPVELEKDKQLES